jgi:DNA-binding MarR family transcriptional regulator
MLRIREVPRNTREATVKQKRAELLEAMARAMREVSGLSVLHSQAMAAALGINSTDLECLDLVMLRGRVTAGELADLTGLTSGAITGVIDRLEKVRFVRRDRDPSDRRKVFVEVLPSVQADLNPLGVPMQDAVFGVLAKYKDADLEMLLEILSRLQEAGVSAIQEVRARAAKGRRERNS